MYLRSKVCYLYYYYSNIKNGDENVTLLETGHNLRQKSSPLFFLNTS